MKGHKVSNDTPNPKDWATRALSDANELEHGEEFFTLESPAKRAASDISPKVSGGLAAGAIATLVVFVAQQFGLEVPTGVEGALSVLIGAVAGYLIPDRR